MPVRFIDPSTPLFSNSTTPVMGDEQCCECCEPPTCNLTGERSGPFTDDVTLTWSTSDENGETATLIDSEGNVISTDLAGTIVIERGSCKSYTLTVINPCGTIECNWTPPEKDPCGCTDCPYDPGEGEIDNPQPASVCVPCGCQRGRGTALTVTIAGLPAEFIQGPLEALFLYNPGSGCDRSGDCGWFTDTLYTPAEKVEIYGLDEINGTYVFELGSSDCPTCGAPFKCTIDPGGFHLGQITAIVNNDPTPGCMAIPHRPDSTITIDLCLAWSTPAKTSPPTFSPRTCQQGSFPSIYFRVVSNDNGWHGPTDDDWFPLRYNQFVLTDNGCEKTYEPGLVVDDDIFPDGPWLINSCSGYTSGQGPFYNAFGWGTDADAVTGEWISFSRYLWPYFATIDFEHTTVGWDA